MSSIHISRKHKLPPKKARAAAEASAKRLAEEFDLKYRWEGEHKLRFHRSGVDGHLELERGAVHIMVTLGLLLRPFRARIEQEVHRNLDELFGAKA